MPEDFPENTAAKLRESGSVLTVGTFDGVHKGHRAILDQVVSTAGAEGCPGVIVTFDPHPRSVVGKSGPMELLTPITERISLLKSFGIDEVVVVPFTPAFADLSPEAYIQDFLVKSFAPKAIVTGYDHHFGKGRAGNFDTLARFAPVFNYRLSEIPATTIDEAAVSSTKIRTALREGRVADAARMLGRPYALTGTVVKGKQLGRTIGFPTANVVPLEPAQLIPAEGVYAAIAETEIGLKAKAMVNIGRRPTVETGGERTIEANLLDNFSGNLYDQTLRLSFIERLRAEQKFASLDALKAQLAQDRSQAERVLEGVL